MSDSNEEQPLEERVAELEEQVKYLKDFHPPNPADFFDLDASRTVTYPSNDGEEKTVEIEMTQERGADYLKRRPSKIVAGFQERGAISPYTMSMDREEMKVPGPEIAEFYYDVISESFDVQLVVDED